MTTHSLQTISGRFVRLPIAERQYQQLMIHLINQVGETGCDHTLRHAEAWARTRGIEWDRLRRALYAGGGYCDCEVTYNVIDAGVHEQAYDDDEDDYDDD